MDGSVERRHHGRRVRFIARGRHRGHGDRAASAPATEARHRSRPRRTRGIRAMVEQVPAVAYTWDPSHQPGAAPPPTSARRSNASSGTPRTNGSTTPRRGSGRCIRTISRASWRRGHEAVGPGNASSRSTASVRQTACRCGCATRPWLPVTNDGVARCRGVMYDVTSRTGDGSGPEERRGTVPVPRGALPAVTYSAMCTSTSREIASTTSPLGWRTGRLHAGGMGLVPGHVGVQVHPEDAGRDRRSPAHGLGRASRSTPSTGS